MSVDKSAGRINTATFTFSAKPELLIGGVKQPFKEMKLPNGETINGVRLSDGSLARLTQRDKDGMWDVTLTAHGGKDLSKRTIRLGEGGHISRLGTVKGDSYKLKEEGQLLSGKRIKLNQAMFKELTEGVKPTSPPLEGIVIRTPETPKKTTPSTNPFDDYVPPTVPKKTTPSTNPFDDYVPPTVPKKTTPSTNPFDDYVPPTVPKKTTPSTNPFDDYVPPTVPKKTTPSTNPFDDYVPPTVPKKTTPSTNPFDDYVPPTVPKKTTPSTNPFDDYVPPTVPKKTTPSTNPFDDYVPPTVPKKTTPSTNPFDDYVPPTVPKKTEN